MSNEIRPDQLTQAIGEILQTFNHSVNTLVDDAAKEVGREGAAILRSNSPARSGRYASTWTSKQTKRGTVYIYNSKNYRLTHLLEKGHKTVLRNGLYGSKSRTAAIPHISRVEDIVQEEFPAKIARAIEYQR